MDGWIDGSVDQCPCDGEWMVKGWMGGSMDQWISACVMVNGQRL